MSLSNKKGKLTYSLVLDRFCSFWLVFDFVSNHRLLPRQILNCPVCKLGGFCIARPRWFRQEVNQALMSAVSKNLLICIFCGLLCNHGYCCNRVETVDDTSKKICRNF